MTNRRTAQPPPIATGTVSRRTALSGLAGTGLAAIVTTLGAASARAQATPTPEIPPGYNPNTYSLEGPDTRISYGTTSMLGQPILSYTGAYPEQTFHGDEIKVEGSAALGRMVSVPLAPPPDARAAWLTLLLPGIPPIQPGDPPVAFATMAIITTYPVASDGPGQTYEAVPLEGKAGFAVS
jgi:hypothetical protein